MISISLQLETSAAAREPSTVTVRSREGVERIDYFLGIIKMGAGREHGNTLVFVARHHLHVQ